MKMQYSNDNWTSEPGDDLPRFLLGWTIDSSQKLELADISNPAKHGQPPTPQNSVHCHDSLNHVVPVQKVLREDAFRWCGITPQRWDELNGKHPTPLTSNEMPARDGMTWTNGDPTFKDGTTTVKLSHSLIIVEQGSTSARFYVSPQGIGIVLVPPPDARSRETHNTQTHMYVNTGNGDPTRSYPDGPPPAMIAKLGPFVQVAMKAIDQAKQSPQGTNWDDQYFRNILKPCDTSPASNLR
jgi:hypothetical protein